MDTNKHELIFKDEIYRVVGCAIHVLNTLGHGFSEKVYENAMMVEFQDQGIPYSQQKRFQVVYKEKIVGEYIPDMIVFDQIVVEIKTVDRLTTQEKSQVLNYLKVTGFKAGVILNFKNTKLEWERVVL